MFEAVFHKNPHLDQLYNLDVLKHHLKIGYVSILHMFT